MRKMHESIATAGGIGYLGRGSGSVAALVYCIVLYLVYNPVNVLWQLPVLAVILAAGIWSSNVLEQWWGHDSNKIVIDEVAGMMISLLLLPASVKYIITGFILFRFFDIVKPLGIKKA